jgi:hypothetical protein
VERLRPSSLQELDGGLIIHGGTEVVPLLRDGILEPIRSWTCAGSSRAACRGGTIGAGTTLAEPVGPQVPEALRGPAASPPRRSFATWAAGNLLQ